MPNLAGTGPPDLTYSHNDFRADHNGDDVWPRIYLRHDLLHHARLEVSLRKRFVS